MKDEAAGVPINEFVGLRSKVYSYCIDDKYIKKCKGVAKGVVKKSMNLRITKILCLTLHKWSTR